MQTMAGGSDSGASDKKRLYPMELAVSTSFRSWPERFVARVSMDNEDVGRAFVRSGKRKQPLDVSSPSTIQVSYSKAIYGHRELQEGRQDRAPCGR